MKQQPLNVLITGAGSGLGRGMSLALAEHGHRILATDLHAASAEETAAMIVAQNGKASGYPLDVTNDADVQSVMDAVGEKRIDVLINNAGLQHVAPLEEFPQEKWDEIIKVMLSGTCVMTRAVLPRMKQNGFGRIVNIGSIHSLIASPFKSAYTAAKHGILGFSRVVALETAEFDITINTICPSYIRTPLVEAQIAKQAQAHNVPEEEVIQKIMLLPMPKNAFITIEEVAATATFLMSHQARNITGQTITVDGGWTAQ